MMAEKFQEMLDALYRIFYAIKRIPRTTKIGILNIIRFFPIVWQDRNWDQYFFWKLLEFKFNSMYEYFQKDTIIKIEDESPYLALKRLAEIAKDLSEDNWDHYDDLIFSCEYYTQELTEERKRIISSQQEKAEQYYSSMMQEFSDLLTKYSRYWWD